MQDTIFISVTGHAEYNVIAISLDHNKDRKAVMVYGYPGVDKFDGNTPSIVITSQVNQKIFDMPRLNKKKLEAIRTQFNNEVEERKSTGGAFLSLLLAQFSLTLPSIVIVPVNEPRGEGNGWEKCTESEATSFQIDDMEGNLLHGTTTRAEAEQWVKEQANR